jgi:hypothetical protein
MGDVVDFKIKEKTKSYNTNTYGLDSITIDGVDIDWGDISYDGTLMTSVITDIISQDYADELKSKNDQMENFIRSLLNPDGFGHAVSAEVRDEARYVLGMKKVETI